MAFWFGNLFGGDLAIDLGTANTLIYLKGKGLLLNEPSMIAVRRDDYHIVAVGNEAKVMWGKTPDSIMTVRPMKDGVIADFDLAEMMIRRFIQKIRLKKFALHRMVISIPSGITAVERRAVRDSGEKAGARAVYLLEEPMAAALGVNLPIDEPVGSMVVDIGGGTTEIAVISLSGVVSKISVRIAGDEMNEVIIQYFKKRYKLLIGEVMAEKVKIDYGSVRPVKDERVVQVRGRDIISGIPRTVEVRAAEIQDVLEEPVQAIIDSVMLCLEKTPPELSSDILDRGIIMTGGGSMLKGLDLRLRQDTNLPVSLSERPLTAVVEGCGVVMEDISRFQRVLNLKVRR
ncbi:rod shape-determining protein [bacterium]|nr:rod shape-determining protein [bacterium]